MLITIQVANSALKLANHLDDPEAIYVSELNIQSISLKKGLAQDRFGFSIPTRVLEHINMVGLGFFYDTPIKVYVQGQSIFSGYIDKIEDRGNGIVNLDVASSHTYTLKQSMSPNLHQTCQNQIYSYNCGLNAYSYSCEATDVELTCFDGSIPYTVNQTDLFLDGQHCIVQTPAFYNKNNLINAFVIINGIYKSKIIRVSDTHIFLAMKFLDYSFTIESIRLYLACDKTYGLCYKRFDNVQHFWGFPNIGQQLQRIDIFSSTALEYCGEDMADTTLEPCDTDHHLFGVEL
jgi:hypothetical protein